MRIGLVLPAVPGYSETFFRNKIRYLNETPGFTVVLFADHFLRTDAFDLCEVVFAPKFSTRPVVAVVQRILWLALSFLRNPGKVMKLWRLNYRAGFSKKRNLASVLSSAHLFSARLDWLHFGFGTMAIGRENLANVLGAKLAVSFRGFDHYIYPLKNPGCYSLLFQLVDQVHVLSQAMKKSLVNQRVPIDKIVVITPAIVTDMFSNPGKDIKGDNPIIKIITVARLHWIKGLEYTLEALALLRDKKINFHYTIVGEGGERERLIFAVNQVKLNDRVTLAGRLGQGEIIEKLKGSDIYLQYSIQEGFCNAVLEAQAMGLLCVVSDAEGLAENVLHEKTGWVVPKRNPALLAAKIGEVIGLDDSALSSIRSHAVKRVKDDFNLEKQRAGFYSIYTQNA